MTADEVREKLIYRGKLYEEELDWQTIDYSHPDYSVGTVLIEGERFYVSVSRA